MNFREGVRRNKFDGNPDRSYFQSFRFRKYHKNFAMTERLLSVTFEMCRDSEDWILATIRTSTFVLTSSWARATLKQYERIESKMFDGCEFY